MPAFAQNAKLLQTPTRLRASHTVLLRQAIAQRAVRIAQLEPSDKVALLAPSARD